MKGSAFWLRHIQEYITTIVHVLEPATTNTSFTGMTIDISQEDTHMYPARLYELRFRKEEDAIAFAVYYENRFRAAIQKMGRFTLVVTVHYNKERNRYMTQIRYVPNEKGQG